MIDPFADAVAHHKAGRLDVAADMYQRILAVDPDHADSLNLLGVILHQAGSDARAAQLLERAIQIDPTRPSYHVNLATAYRGLGRHEEGCRHCEKALELQPELAEARLALGLSLRALKRWPQAEGHLRWMASTYPADSRGPQALAGCLRDQGRTDEAIALYHEALARNSDDAPTHLGLGTTLLVDRHDPAAAELYLRRATELRPGEASAWKNYGTCLMLLGRAREAVAVFQAGFNAAPNDLELGVNLGRAHLECGEEKAAENCFRAVLNFRPDFPVAVHGLADVALASDRSEEAIPLYERALQLDPTLDAYKGLAEALWDTGDVTRAVSILRDGIARHPQDADNHVRLATMLASGGDLSSAVAECRTALRLRPGFPRALIQLAQTRRAEISDTERHQLAAALERPATELHHAGIRFALAQVDDGRGDFKSAAEHLREANVLARKYHATRGKPYDPAEYSRYVDEMIATFSPDLFTRLKDAGVDSERPIFIIGLPRSGTTLVEQILASHPKAFGAGERRFAYQGLIGLATELGCPTTPLACLDRASLPMVRRRAEDHFERLRQLDSGRAERVVDKMPDNYILLGWLAIQFPKARFIHCRRDVRDVALSCWMTNFTRLNWANDLEHIARRILDYQRLMDHWQRVLPVQLIEMDYEKLVANQDGESRRLIAAVGLPWDAACLQFHESERLVKTASATQVRQPMYSRSVGRWKNYEDALQPFLRLMDT